MIASKIIFLNIINWSTRPVEDYNTCFSVSKSRAVILVTTNADRRSFNLGTKKENNSLNEYT